MYKSVFVASTLLVGVIGNSLVLADDSSLKEDAKKVGQETGQVVRKIGEGGKEVGKKVAETAREVGHATRDGAKEFAKAVKGEDQSSSTNSSASSSSSAYQHKSN